MTKTLVIATFRMVGFHRWKDAPEPVAYLRDSHRHEFKYRVEVEVTHGDRDIEFHLLKRHCLLTLRLMYPFSHTDELDFGERSCEHLAQELHASLTRDNYRVAAIEVWEDSECGARLTFSEAA